MVTTNKPLVCFSLTRGEHDRLADGGPRRDITLLAEQVDGELLFRTSNSKRRGLVGKLAGSHFKHAWTAARKASVHSVIFADGEHVGFPLAAFLAIRGRRRTRLIILGHYVDKSWKRALLWAASRLVRNGTLILHSSVQAERVRTALGPTWSSELLPYQVDTAYWWGPPLRTPRPLIIAAGSENRDYGTLIEAVRGLDVDVEIASGSHWARAQASATDLPPNVRFLIETLSFADLRTLYAKAAAIVVPLEPVNNQSGITTILEAMSMAKPVIVTATPGQREAVSGPVVQGDGSLLAEPSRGPQVYGFHTREVATGLYVPPADPVALRKAIGMVLEDAELAKRLSRAARVSATEHFSVEDFARRFGAVISKECAGERANAVSVSVA